MFGPGLASSNETSLSKPKIKSSSDCSHEREAIDDATTRVSRIGCE